MKNCPNCGAQLRDEAKFCYNCGQKVFIEKPVKMIFCEECGEQIESTVKNCPFCGAEIFSHDFEDENQKNEKISVIEEEDKTSQANVFVPIVSSPATTEEQRGETEELQKEEENLLVSAIRCPQCGSTDVKMTTEKTGECLHCGAMITIDDRPKKVVNDVKVFLSNAGDVGVSFYKVKADKSEKTFIKDVYHSLAEHEDTPIDIFDYKFYPTTTEEKTVVAYRGNVHLTYSVMIGIDREVMYVEDGKRKYKTVTDWHPMSGTHEGNYIVGIRDGDVTYSETLSDENRYAGYFEHAVETAKKIEEFDGEGVVLTQKNAEAGKEALIEKAALACRYGLSGNHVSDFKYSATVDLKEIRGYVIPEYSVAYKEDEESEKTYVASAFAAGDDFVYGECPDDTRNINAYTTISNLKFTIPSIAFLLASIIVSLVVNNATVMYVVGILAIAFFVFSVLIANRIRKNVIKKNIEIKKTKMEELIQEQGLDK